MRQICVDCETDGIGQHQGSYLVMLCLLVLPIFPVLLTSVLMAGDDMKEARVEAIAYFVAFSIPYLYVTLCPFVVYFAWFTSKPNNVCPWCGGHMVPPKTVRGSKLLEAKGGFSTPERIKFQMPPPVTKTIAFLTDKMLWSWILVIATGLVCAFGIASIFK